MSKNLPHLTSVHEAAQQLHSLLMGVPWYVGVQVMTIQPPKGAAATEKQEQKEIVVFVKSSEDLDGKQDKFNSWPVRYEVGNG